MEIKGAYDDFDDTLRNAPRDDRNQTGFVENYQTALGVTMNENMSFSSMMNNQMYDDRDENVWKHVENGNIPEDIVESFNGDTGAIARYARTELGLTDIALDDELLDQRQKLIQGDADRATKIKSQAGAMGKVGAFLGELNAMLIDPVYLPTYLVGIGEVARGSQVLAAAARVGAVEAGAEALKQIPVYNHKQNMGIDYSVTDAMKEVGINAGFAVTAELGILGFVAGLKRFSRGRVPQTGVEITAKQNIDAELTDLANHTENGGLPDGSITDHMETKEALKKNINEKPPLSDPDAPIPSKTADLAWMEIDTAYKEVLETAPQNDLKIAEGTRQVQEAEKAYQKAMEMEKC